MHNKLLNIIILLALDGLCYFDPFKKRVYYAMSYFDLVKPQYIELVGLVKERVNLYFERREIKATFLYFAILSYLTMLH